MSTLRTLVIASNIVLFGYLVASVQGAGLSGGEWVSFLAVLLLILLNIYFIASKKGDTWISLFLKRKALEEKKKIENLEIKKE